MMQTETSLDTMSELRTLPGYRELVRVCKAYNASWNRNGGRTGRTRKAETYLIERVEAFCAEHEVLERDVMWTIGWDSAD